MIKHQYENNYENISDNRMLASDLLIQNVEVNVLHRFALYKILNLVNYNIKHPSLLTVKNTADLDSIMATVLLCLNIYLC